MKYLGLVYIDENKLDAMSASDCLAYAATLKETGQCLAAEALECSPTVTNVRVQNGAVSATDGPFIETKEYLAGVYLLEVGDRDEAVRLMAGIPAASAGRIELRSIWEAGTS